MDDGPEFPCFHADSPGGHVIGVVMAFRRDSWQRRTISTTGMRGGGQRLSQHAHPHGAHHSRSHGSLCAPPFVVRLWVRAKCTSGVVVWCACELACSCRCENARGSCPFVFFPFNWDLAFWLWLYVLKCHRWEIAACAAVKLAFW